MEKHILVSLYTIFKYCVRVGRARVGEHAQEAEQEHGSSSQQSLCHNRSHPPVTFVNSLNIYYRTILKDTYNIYEKMCKNIKNHA